MDSFEPLNKAYTQVFNTGKMSLGLVVPIESYAIGAMPTMNQQVKRVQQAEALGFSAIWLRDIPLHVPAFGDVGQMYDPFTYLGYLAGQTNKIALGVASIALPLHHPLHLAKAAATIDQLTQGRLLLGVASGDRPEEYPAMGFQAQVRGERFRESFAYIRAAQQHFPTYQSTYYGMLDGSVDVLPKPYGKRLPMFVTGNSRQSESWIAEHADAWIYYLRNPAMQRATVMRWQEEVAKFSATPKPFMQAMYVNLHPDPDFRPEPIQLGFKAGINFLVEFCQLLQDIGVNHTAINLRFDTGNIDQTLNCFAERLLPLFPTKNAT